MFRRVLLVAVLAPLVVFAVLFVVAAINGWQVRSQPTFLLLIVPVIAGLLGGALTLTWWLDETVQEDDAGTGCFKGIALTFVWLAAFFLSAIVFVFAGFSLNPEHEREFDGVPAVAEVDSFLDVYVYYYDAHGPLFKGRNAIGSEWYGSGGYDPFEHDPNPLPLRRTVRGIDVISPEMVAPTEPEREWGVGEDGEPLTPEEQAAKAQAETEAAFEETGSVYRVTGTVTSQIDSDTGKFEFRVDDGQGVLEDGTTYQVVENPDVRRLYGMKGLQWGMDGVVIGFADMPGNDDVLHAGVIIGNDDTSSAYWENMG